MWTIVQLGICFSRGRIDYSNTIWLYWIDQKQEIQWNKLCNMNYLIRVFVYIEVFITEL